MLGREHDVQALLDMRVRGEGFKSRVEGKFIARDSAKYPMLCVRVNLIGPCE